MIDTLSAQIRSTRARISSLGSVAEGGGKEPHPGVGAGPRAGAAAAAERKPSALRGSRLTPFLYSPRGRARRGPAPGLVDSDFLARNRTLPNPRARPRDCRRLLLRRARTDQRVQDRKSTRLNSSHEWISYAVFCLKK